MNPEEKLADNVKQGKDAQEIVDAYADRPEHFWTVLACLSVEKGGKVVPKTREVEPMSYDQAYAFEKERLPFGKYEGDRVMDAPLSYLVNVMEETPFTRNLRRYVTSARYRQLVQEAEDHG